MNAKELRAAAEVKLSSSKAMAGLVDPSSIENAPDGSILKWIADDIAMSEYILATVREDDDEPVTKSWVMELDAYGFMEIDGGVWCILTDSHLPVDMTRGQFRALCRGLGIELKEKQNAE